MNFWFEIKHFFFVIFIWEPFRRVTVKKIKNNRFPTFAHFLPFQEKSTFLMWLLPTGPLTCQSDYLVTVLMERYKYAGQHLLKYIPLHCIICIYTKYHICNLSPNTFLQNFSFLQHHYRRKCPEKCRCIQSKNVCNTAH